MSESRPIEIKVIYRASGRRGADGAAAPAPRQSAKSGATDARSESAKPKAQSKKIVAHRRTGIIPAVLIGVLSLAVAGSYYYVAWWKIDPTITKDMFFRAPLPLSDSEIESFGAALLGGTKAKAPVLSAEEQAAKDRAERERIEVAQRANIELGLTWYGWLTIVMVAVCAMSLVFGASVSVHAGAAGKAAGTIMTLVVAAALIAGGFIVWGQYREGFPVWASKLATGGLAVFFLCLGSLLGRHLRGACKLAAILVILSAVASGIGLWIGGRHDVIPADRAAPTVIALVFVVQSLFGWVLLLAAPRVRV